MGGLVASCTRLLAGCLVIVACQSRDSVTAEDVAVQTSVFTRRGCQRIIRAAFEKAVTRPCKKVTSVTKSNAQGYGMVLWDEVFVDIAGEFPDVETLPGHGEEAPLRQAAVAFTPPFKPTLGSQRPKEALFP